MIKKNSLGPLRYCCSTPSLSAASTIAESPIFFILELKLLFALLLMCFSTALYSQEQSLSNIRTRIVSPAATPDVVLDSLTVAYSSIWVKELSTGKILDTTYYQLKDNTIFFMDKTQLMDSLFIQYRRLPYAFSKRLARLDTSEAAIQQDGIIGITYNPYEQDDALLDFKGLDYNGNFTRGVAFGNNQDLVLNSSFNLQLAGELGDGVEILAAITDENIPLQPEGNTQQLQEFDRIFVQLKRNNASLTAGDYELQRPDSYFVNYFKKLQGLTFNYDDIGIGEGQLSTKASIAISRGQFTRNQIEAIEGNQGPYRLRGAEGERFIIVLAGTEKVFVDGGQLERGLEADYVIDYNRGELTFTNKQLITKDSRIVVEFEYADQAYVRSLYAMETRYQLKKLKLNLNVFSQQDSRNATGNLQLTDEDKRILSEAGDNPIAALGNGIDTLEEFSPFRVAYKMVDTVLSCFPDTMLSYLVFTTNPDSAVFSARFSFVGAGAGQYILDETQAANERVYRWVGVDDNCTPLGDYEPVVQLTPPRQQQLFSLGAQYNWAKNGLIDAEVAFSNNDLNRFSRLGSGDDVGMATYLKARRSDKLGKDSLAFRLETTLSYEMVQANFKPLNPYRNPEFLRDWNLANVQGVGTVQAALEQIGLGKLTLIKPGVGQLFYGFSTFLRDSLYNGQRHELGLDARLSNWEARFNGSLLDTEEPTATGQFWRPNGTITRVLPRLRGLKVGVAGELEKNERFEVGIDTLTPSSFFFKRYRFFIELPEQEQFTLGASASQRTDYAPTAANFEQSTKATEANINGRWGIKSPKNRLTLAGNLTYRKLSVNLPEIVNQTAGETYLGRTDLGFSLAKGVFQSSTTYEIGSGQEPKVEFTYVQVNPGEGNYIWLDSLYNNDGIIQPNEMEVAPFQDLADYIRVSTITDDFIRTNNVNLNQNLRVSPKAIWYNKKGIQKFATRFATLSNLSIRRKTQKSDEITPFNPFQLDVIDTALVAVSSSIRNVLFFNQGNPVYDFQVGMSDNRNKFVQTSGFESRSNAEQFFKSRWNITKNWSTRFEVNQGEKRSDSEFFNNKDFQVRFFSLSPELSFLPSRNFRANIKFLYQEDENVLTEGAGEKAWRNEFELEARYNKSARRAIQLQFSYINVRFRGTPNSPVGFAILNGLQRGQNFLWGVSIDQQLAKNLQLRLSYEGRKTGTANIVHTGRAQVAANF